MPEMISSCLYCGRSSSEVPLLRMLYQGKEIYICPQHLPILIHHPAQLADKLPGAQNFGPPAEGHGSH